MTICWIDPLYPPQSGKVQARRQRREYPYSGEQAYRLGKPTGIVDPRPVLKVIGGISGYRSLFRKD